MLRQWSLASTRDTTCSSCSGSQRNCLSAGSTNLKFKVYLVDKIANAISSFLLPKFSVAKLAPYQLTVHRVQQIVCCKLSYFMIMVKIFFVPTNTTAYTDLWSGINFKIIRSKTYWAEFEPLIHFYDAAWNKEFIRESQALNTITNYPVTVFNMIGMDYFLNRVLKMLLCPL